MQKFVYRYESKFNQKLKPMKNLKLKVAGIIFVLLMGITIVDGWSAIFEGLTELFVTGVFVIVCLLIGILVMMGFKKVKNML